MAWLLGPPCIQWQVTRKKWTLFHLSKFTAMIKKYFYLGKMAMPHALRLTARTFSTVRSNCRSNKGRSLFSPVGKDHQWVHRPSPIVNRYLPCTTDDSHRLPRKVNMSRLNKSLSPRPLIDQVLSYLPAATSRHGTTTTSSQHARPSGVLRRWSDGLEYVAWRPPRPVAQCHPFQEDTKDASVSECTRTLSALEALRI